VVGLDKKTVKRSGSSKNLEIDKVYKNAFTAIPVSKADDDAAET
jgi:hypothetical protein